MDWQSLIWWAFAVGTCAGSAYWLVAAVLTARVIRSVPVLEDITPAATPPTESGEWPLVSIIVPACNEAESLEAAMVSKLADDYPHIEFILVNDRSTDETPAIVDRLAARDSRIRALHISELPPGWLGKVHAMHEAIGRSRGEWILLTDADVHFEPGALRRAMTFALEKRADHMAILPEFWSSAFWLDTVVAAFLRVALLGARVWAIEDPRSTASVGVGAFNLVRRAAYEKTPGLEWLKLEVIDDAGLGKMLKQHGARSVFLNGRGMVQLYWYRNLREMFIGAEKNAYSGLGAYRMSRLLVGLVVYVWCELAPLMAIAQWQVEWLRWAGVAALAAGTIAGAAMCRWARRPVLAGLLSPVGAVLFALAALRSGVLAERRGGIRWRTTLYRLDELRAGARFMFP